MKQISVIPIVQPSSSNDMDQAFITVDDSSAAHVVDVVQIPDPALVIELFQKDNFTSQVEIRLSPFHVPVSSEPDNLLADIDDGFKFVRVIQFSDGTKFVLSVPSVLRCS